MIFFCGGTTVSADLIREATASYPHCLCFRAYGSTEMPTTTLGIRDQVHADLGAETDGEVVPPTEVKIVDASSAPGQACPEPSRRAQGERDVAGAGRRLDRQVPVAGDCGLREHGGGTKQRRQNETRTSHESRLLKKWMRTDQIRDERTVDVTTGYD